MGFETSALPESYADLKAFTLSLLSTLHEQAHSLESQASELKTQALYIEKLKFELARLKRWRFGAHSEKLDFDQLALWQAELESDIATVATQLQGAQASLAAPRAKAIPKREKLPDWLPRVEHRHDPDSKHCEHCGSVMIQIGEEISEQLDLIPAQFFVRRHIRPKLACRHCETVVSPELPNQPIDKGLPAPGLLAQVLVSKYQDHLPLHRQQGIYARMGVELPRSTMAGWIGQLQVLLEPLVERIHSQTITERYLQADETPVPVLDPGSGKTSTGYLWAYRTGPWSKLQAVVFDFQPNRGAQAPKRFLQGFEGTLQVDGYAGYGEALQSGKVVEAGCFAHARRKFFEVHEATKSPLAREALVEIAQLYEIEAQVKDLTPAERAALRRSRAGPILDRFKQWLEETLAKSPPRSALAKAIGYTLNRWRALVRYLDDGMLNIDQNPVERAIRGIALGRRNWLFAGSENGGRRCSIRSSRPRN